MAAKKTAKKRGWVAKNSADKERSVAYTRKSSPKVRAVSEGVGGAAAGYGMTMFGSKKAKVLGTLGGAALGAALGGGNAALDNRNIAKQRAKHKISPKYEAEYTPKPRKKRVKSK